MSRYAVSNPFRQREVKVSYPDVPAAELPAHEFRRLVPHVSLGLLRGVASLAAARARRHRGSRFESIVLSVGPGR
jgi:hypothetical protein